MLEYIYETQRELMKKYHKIEEKNGLMLYNEIPVDLDDKFAQARIKDFCWRFTEELAEALHEAEEDNHFLYQEELIDCLHFLTELSILVDFLPKDMAHRMQWYNSDNILENLFDYAENYLYLGHSKQTLMMSVVKNIGLMANELKNRPWKQSHRETDKEKFYDYLMKAWRAFTRLFVEAQMTPQTVYEAYVSKSNENKSRQKRGY